MGTGLYMCIYYCTCTFRNLESRDCLDKYLASAFGVTRVEVEEDGKKTLRLKEIDAKNYVLTLDFAMKVLHMLSDTVYRLFFCDSYYFVLVIANFGFTCRVTAWTVCDSVFCGLCTVFFFHYTLGNKRSISHNS